MEPSSETKKKNDKLPLIAAVVLGVLSVLAVNQYINQQTEVVQEQKMRVLCANKSLKKGATITLDDMATKIIPKSLMTKQFFDASNPKSAMQMVKGQVLTHSVDAGSLILSTNFEEVRVEAQTLSRILPEDRRAVTLAVNQLTAVGYNVVPGDYVDIMATIEPDGMQSFGLNSDLIRSVGGVVPNKNKSNTSPITVLLMQQVRVLATGANYDTTTGGRQQRSYGSLTLDVTPKEAALLTHARRLGSLSFVLRNFGSQDRVTKPSEIQISDKNLTEQIQSVDETRKVLTIDQGGRATHQFMK